MKKFLMTALEFMGGVIMTLLFIMMIWVLIIATPDQSSAECEALREDMRQSGLID